MQEHTRGGPEGCRLDPVRASCTRLAERQGFEPWRRFPAYTRSRRAPSTTRPPLRESTTDYTVRRQAARLYGTRCSGSRNIRLNEHPTMRFPSRSARSGWNQRRPIPEIPNSTTAAEPEQTETETQAASWAKNLNGRPATACSRCIQGRCQTPPCSGHPAPRGATRYPSDVCSRDD